MEIPSPSDFSFLFDYALFCKIQPSGFYLEGDYPYPQDRDFVLRRRLLLRASGYSVSKFSSGEEAKATFQDKLGRKHFAGPGAKRMHVKVRD